VGTAAMVMKMLKLPDGRVKILVQGLAKGTIKEYIQEKPLFVAHLRSEGDFYRDVRPVPSGPVICTAGPSALCLVIPLVPEIEKTDKTAPADHEDIAPLPAVAPVGTASRHKFFPSKADPSSTAIPRLYVKRSFVDEFHPTG